MGQPSRRWMERSVYQGAPGPIDVAGLLAELRARPLPEEPSAEAAAVAAIVERRLPANVVAMPDRTPGMLRPAVRLATKVSAAAMIVVLSAGSSLALTGGLPEPTREAATRALAMVGFEPDVGRSDLGRQTRSTLPLADGDEPLVVADIPWEQPPVDLRLDDEVARPGDGTIPTDETGTTEDGSGPPADPSERGDGNGTGAGPSPSDGGTPPAVPPSSDAPSTPPEPGTPLADPPGKGEDKGKGEGKGKGDDKDRGGPPARDEEDPSAAPPGGGSGSPPAAPPASPPASPPAAPPTSPPATPPSPGSPSASAPGKPTASPTPTPQSQGSGTPPASAPGKPQATPSA